MGCSCLPNLDNTVVFNLFFLFFTFCSLSSVVVVSKVATGLCKTLKLSARGCFGCCTKSQPIIAVDEPSKGLRIQGRLVKKPSISEDFWSTSTCDLENSMVQSQRSMSSISISNQSLSQQGGTGNSINHSEFVNHGKYTLQSPLYCWLSFQ
ncbi:unnamed protein product [Coffea canephora]|uniref:Uncharacterized protein n=1 Tax=Coffea canephora TaxID=49390 RepID=A0A068UQ21_COFCA|nr:unnamed protein product [Coffea canephora]